MPHAELANIRFPPHETARFVISDIRDAPDQMVADFLNADDHAYERRSPFRRKNYPTYTSQEAQEAICYIPHGSCFLIQRKEHHGERTPVGHFALFGHEGNSIRISPFILPSARGNGAIVEAYRGLMQGLQAQASIERVYLEVKTNNRAMKRVMEKLGAKELGEALPIVPNILMPEDETVLRYEFDLTRPLMQGSQPVSSATPSGRRP